MVGTSAKESLEPSGDYVGHFPYVAPTKQQTEDVRGTTLTLVLMYLHFRILDKAGNVGLTLLIRSETSRSVPLSAEKRCHDRQNDRLPGYSTC